MANQHSTESARLAGVAPAFQPWISAIQNEKISCSFSPLSGIDPVGLLGRHVQVDHVQEYSSLIVTYGALVVGLQLGAPGLGIDSQLLLRPDDGSEDEYVPVAALTVLAVFS
ncbi:hypothetical protein [Pseudomonas huanghezhanensis]|uniref:hypothetical protein n=1 Tax=Pseudomonas huanghezhanensis TaxID=3002903 RepID=UPI0022865411|nr:hypothetical protein [Pseudomonas sp. BSw22131]